MAELPFNQCVAAGVLAGGTCADACAILDVLASGEFIGTLSTSNTCSTTFSVRGPWDDDTGSTVTAGVVVDGTGVEGGATWVLTGVFVGTSCLNAPTRGVFTFTVEAHP